LPPSGLLSSFVFSKVGRGQEGRRPVTKKREEERRRRRRKREKRRAGEW